jgi:hypothetical protein
VIVTRPCIRASIPRDIVLRNDSLRTVRRVTDHVTNQRFLDHWLIPRGFEVFDSDVGTFEAAVALRVLQKVPEPDPQHELWSYAKRFLKKLLRKLKAPLLTYFQVIEHVKKTYSGVKRDRYLKALESLFVKELDVSEAKVTGFTKRQNEDFRDGSKDPRAIQYRCDRWLVFFFVLKAMEHEIYYSRGLINSKDSTSEVCKCLTPKQKAEALVAKVKQLKNPVVIQWDGKRFDAHVNKFALMMEHSFYVNFVRYRGGDWQNFQRLLARQIKNLVSARCYDGKVKYWVEGNRMSGDWNTSIGNVILMVAFVVASLEYLGLTEKDWRILDDGDDCLLVVEADKASLVHSRLKECFLIFGQELVVEDPIPWSDYHKIEFCQSKLINLGGEEYTFVRDYRKAMGTYFNSYKWFGDCKSTKLYLSAIGLGDANLYYRVPILWSLARSTFKLGGMINVSNEDIEKLGLYRFKQIDYSYSCLEGEPIDFHVRNEFARAFGISPVEQINLEHYLESSLSW